MQVTQRTLSFWGYVTGTIALVLALVLLILSSTDKSGAIGYIVGAIASLLVGAAAITLGALASHASKGQKIPDPTPKPSPAPIPTPNVSPPEKSSLPPTPTALEGDSTEAVEDDESASDTNDTASQASITNYTLAPRISIEEDSSVSPLSPPRDAEKPTLRRPVRVSRVGKSFSDPN